MGICKKPGNENAPAVAEAQMFTLANCHTFCLWDVKWNLALLAEWRE
jgi:hypothetical protein